MWNGTLNRFCYTEQVESIKVPLILSSGRHMLRQKYPGSHFIFYSVYWFESFLQSDRLGLISKSFIIQFWRNVENAFSGCR